MGSRPPRRSVLISSRRNPAQSKLDFVLAQGWRRFEATCTFPSLERGGGLAIVLWIIRVQVHVGFHVERSSRHGSANSHWPGRRRRLDGRRLFTLFDRMPEHAQRGPCRQTLPDHWGSAPTVGFSQEPHPSTANGMGNLYGNRGPGSMAQDGMASSGGQGGDGLRHAHPRNEPRLAHGESIRTAGHLGNGRIGTRRDRAVTNSLLGAQPPASQVLAKDPGNTSTIPGSNGGPGGSYP